MYSQLNIVFIKVCYVNCSFSIVIGGLIRKFRGRPVFCKIKNQIKSVKLAPNHSFWSFLRKLYVGHQILELGNPC